MVVLARYSHLMKFLIRYMYSVLMIVLIRYQCLLKILSSYKIPMSSYKILISCILLSYGISFIRYSYLMTSYDTSYKILISYNISYKIIDLRIRLIL